jgi:hypothetical protein
VSIEGPGSPAASALARSLALAQMVAGKIVQSAGASGLESPAASVSQATAPGKCGDCVEISPEARARSEAAERGGEVTEHAADGEAGGVIDVLALSREEQAILRDLQSRDAQVRAHENAHAAAGGALSGSPSFTYETGPDGRQYAVSGEVPIAVRKGATPEETLRNAAQVRGAALAPAEPSSADRRVAASAAALEAQARIEIAQRELEAERGVEDPRVRAYEPPDQADLEPQRLDLFG